MGSPSARSVRYEILLSRAARGEANAGEAPLPPELLDRVYRGIAEWHGQSAQPVQARLVWHHEAAAGAGFYREALCLQRGRFEPTRVVAHNTLAIAPSALGFELLELCSDASCFDAVEAVLEPYSAAVGPAGELDWEQRTAAALERLRSAVGELSGALLLSRTNLHRGRDMLALIARSPVRSWRVRCPAATELAPAEVQAAFERMAELLLAGTRQTRLQPLDDYVQRVLDDHDPSQPCRFRSRRSWEARFTISGNGDVFGPAGARGCEPAYGNLLQASLPAIMSGAAHLRALDASERRQAATCSACRFYGSCPGDAAADASVGWLADGAGGCPVVQPVLESIERRLAAVRSPRAAPAAPGARQSLRAGVRVRWLGQAAEPAGSRLMLSAGTCAPAAGSGRRYLTGALLPRAPFREPSAEERTLLAVAPAGAAGASQPPPAEVAIFRVAERVLLPLRAICEQSGLYAEPPAAGADARAHPNWQHALDALFAELQPFCAGPEAIEATTLYRSAPGLPTVTLTDRGNPEREALAGLHLDSWEGSPLRARAFVRNRIGINLSRQERYFLFVNLPLAEMMRALGLREDEDLSEVTLFAGHKFLRRFPDYPVVRLALAPFEAYLAPTGNLVHDGASPTGPHPDLALHLLGHFSIPAS